MSISSNWNLDLSVTFTDGSFYSQQLKLSDVISSNGSIQAKLQDKNGLVAPVQIWLQSVACNSASVHVLEYMIRNPSAMDHPNGNWDLGAAGNLLIESCKLQLSQTNGVSFSDLNATAFETGDVFNAKESIVIHQASSGGDFWNSHNHIDRNGTCPLPFKGYRLVCDAKENRGNRITPILRATCENQIVGLTVKDFWQNFPIRLQANAEHLSLEILSSTDDPPAELQGGEQKTFEIAIEFTETKAVSSLIDWIERADEPSSSKIEEVLNSIPYLTARSDQSDPRYEALVDLAIEGNDTFFQKREVIDEYGWRHYGDLWADHEAVENKSDTPLISHNNNQYDCILGFGIQYLRTRERRWWDLLIPLADHTWDIDTYHTEQDKLLYNQGMFWHTYHYADAHTSTHRSYPRRITTEKQFSGGKDLTKMGETGRSLEKNYLVGGGPAASHNYSTGWWLTYLLTGKTRYKTAAINAADYVMQIEDGSKTIFRWLSRSQTGNSTASGDGYYGPGRAAANSTHALLTGFEITGNPKYLQRAELLMYRTVHPEQDLNELDLLNAELRWFYTMYLESLCRFLSCKRINNQIDDSYQYGVACLRHYATWMVINERPTLSEPDQLQYPTETWAAQDLRKWHILEIAAKYESNEKIRDQLLTKANFFYEYCIQYLSNCETKSLCRPQALILNIGWQRAAFISDTDTTSPSSIQKTFKKQKIFKPQKTIAIERAKKISLASIAALFIAVLAITVAKLS